MTLTVATSKANREGSPIAVVSNAIGPGVTTSRDISWCGGGDHFGGTAPAADRVPVQDLRSTQPLDRSISGHPSAIPVGSCSNVLDESYEK